MIRDFINWYNYDTGGMSIPNRYIFWFDVVLILACIAKIAQEYNML